jgi:UDP-N-acetyl-2-amino-2-deoxyglucuronate dehydrogenase
LTPVSSSVRVGLVGAGNISETHARAVAAIPGASIAAVYAPTLAKAEALAGRFGARPYDSLDRFLDAGGLDMVAVGTPSGLHGEHGRAAAARGFHVLVEKPMEITTARADALIEEAARANVTLGVIYQDRLKPSLRRLKAIVDGGRLGRPLLASARVKWYRPPEYYSGSRWRGTWAFDGGGALMNQGSHTVDVLLWLFGPARRVLARAAALLHGIEVEDTAVAVVEFANGALGTIEATTAAFPGYARRIELTGSEGTAAIEGDRLVSLDLRDGSGAREVDPPADRPESASSPVVSDASAHQAVIEDFIRALSSGGRPMCDGAEGRRSVALIEAVYRSSQTRAAVDLL